MSGGKRTFTVKKTIGGAMSFRKYEDYSIGDITIGEFVGTFTDQFKNDNYKVKVLDASWEDSELATTMIGKTLVFNSCGSLNKQMEQVKEGEIVQIEYNGKSLLTKGPFAGKEAHGVTVSVVEASEESGNDTDGL